MGEEAPLPPSPLQDHNMIRDLNQEYEKIDDSSSAEENETSQEKECEKIDDSSSSVEIESVQEKKYESMDDSSSVEIETVQEKEYEKINDSRWVTEIENVHEKKYESMDDSSSVEIETVQEKVCESIDDSTSAAETETDDSRWVTEIENVNEKDQELENISQDMDQVSRSSIIQTIEDDCIIPSPVLKGIATVTFFGPDLNSALQLLGMKYNSTVKKNQEQTTELETLRADCETMRNKCIEECKPQYETLKQKYTRECLERKRLYNELIELKGNIRVYCRCRPLSADEISRGCTSVLDFDPSQDSELQIICSDSSKKQFKFDHVFGPKDNQETVFAETLPLVNSVLDGYNVCIFAYGQTGTGKTFTMEGDPDNRGVNYRALEELFKSSKERSYMTKYDFSVSLLEVYNEKIRDLLAENSDQAAKKLEIKQAADGTQDVPGLVEALACSTDEVWELLKSGSRNRSVGSTNANELSSRSHCLVRVTIKGENLVNGQRSRSHLWLVDLAGSERVGKIEAEGERLKESQYINKSLSALGDVISGLAAKNAHIPYRNSKLTHLLQSSLGGDCKTLMFAQISPSSSDLGETICSLNFASRVRGVEHGPARKQSDPAESFKLKQMTEKLRQEEKETARLSENLQLMTLKYTSRENVFKTLHEKVRDAEQANKNYQQKVRDLENQLADQRKPRLQDIEHKYRDIEHRLADQKARLQETRESASYSRPPLAPIASRPPFGRMTSRLAPSGSVRRGGSLAPALEDKDNMLATDKGINKGPTKARRISLSPVVYSIPVQPKRRASIAILPASRSEKLPTLHETKERCTNSGTSESRQMRDLKRRRSVTTFMSQPRTPLRTSGVAATPDRKDILGNFSTSSKFSSPPPMQSQWKSKIPHMGSPRQRLRHVPSPGSSSCVGSTQMQNKLCFSVQKRLVVNSPAQQRPSMVPRPSIANQSLRDKEIVGKLGTAQRVLSKNRRKSVI